MVDPATSSFWASWQDGEPLEDVHVIGAEAAIAWGRERSDRVLIRLGHVEGTHFSAGGEHLDVPSWPPAAAPPEGWWTPVDEAAAEARELRGV